MTQLFSTVSIINQRTRPLFLMKRWGKEQRNLYLRDLEKRFLWLSEHPNLGKQRLDIAKGYYSYPQGEHVIFYLIGNGHIDIIGIPHKKMDILSYFSS